jgi:hypothetical protein
VVKRNDGKEIIFSDATWTVNEKNIHKINKRINSWNTIDIAFGDDCEYSSLNIGLIYIKCSGKVMNYLNEVIETFEETDHDQVHMNKILHGIVDMKNYDQWDKYVKKKKSNKFDLEWTTFPRDEIGVWSPDAKKGKYYECDFDRLAIVKQFTGGNMTKSQAWNRRLMYLYKQNAISIIELETNLRNVT